MCWKGEALEALLPGDLAEWMSEAKRQRARWKRDRVAMDARKPLLLDALNRLYASKAADRANGDGGSATPQSQPSASGTERRGHVSLVGAGPGDPGLLTRRAILRLREADLVLYDALIDDRTLRYARKAQRFFVGKRAGRQALTQSAINAVMIRAARRGRRIVRLKGGDPFIFGRGGEEMLALMKAGVAFDVVPGVTSAVAAPALAAIPVTHRGVATALLVVSGHDEEAFARTLQNISRGSGDVTLVILMGRDRAARLAGRLLDTGWRADTPAAVIVDASGAAQSVWRGTLSDLQSGAVETTEGAATIVVGDVVRLADPQAAQALDDAAPGRHDMRRVSPRRA